MHRQAIIPRPNRGGNNRPGFTCAGPRETRHQQGGDEEHTLGADAPEQPRCRHRGDGATGTTSYNARRERLLPRVNRHEPSHENG